MTAPATTGAAPPVTPASSVISSAAAPLAAHDSAAPTDYQQTLSTLLATCTSTADHLVDVVTGDWYVVREHHPTLRVIDVMTAMLHLARQHPDETCQGIGEIYLQPYLPSLRPSSAPTG